MRLVASRLLALRCRQRETSMMPAIHVLLAIGKALKRQVSAHEGNLVRAYGELPVDVS